MSTVHTFPVGDLIAHVTDGGDCPCGPTTEPVMRQDGSSGWHVLHHSLDGREAAEAAVSSSWPAPDSVRCKCLAPDGQRCPWPATQEDGYCDPCRGVCPAWRDDTTSTSEDRDA